jgi:hypothetical protein
LAVDSTAISRLPPQKDEAIAAESNRRSVAGRPAVKGDGKHGAKSSPFRERRVTFA